MSPSRVALASIPSLTFYKDEVTRSRRTAPIPQLVCTGKPCQLYSPDAVRCTNLGGEGTAVDWKCEADLPESLRFGRVEVSCEGWSGPGDPDVLKGSCSLEYRLVQIPKILRTDDSQSFRGRTQVWFATADVGSIVFTVVWTAILLLIVYSLLKSCFRRTSRSSAAPTPSPPHSGSGWFPGGSYSPRRGDPPPPYSKPPPYEHGTQSGTGSWTSGLLTGAALGGVGTALFNNWAGGARPEPRAVPWDWEQERERGGERNRLGLFPAPRRQTTPPGDRGEGPSNLGSIRRSTAFGGSSVR